MNTDLAERRARYHDALKDGLEQAITRLSRLPEVNQIILFGSYRRGRRDLFTDIDLLVVMDSSDNPISRTVRLYRHLGGKIGVDLDLVTYTPQELEENRTGSFLKRVLAEGEVVYERDR